MTTTAQTTTTAASRPTPPSSSLLTPEQLQRFGEEMDAIRQRVLAERGAAGRRLHPRRDPRPARARGRRPRAALGRRLPARLARGHRRALALEDPRQHGDRPQRDARPVRVDERPEALRASSSSGTPPAPPTSGATRTTTCTTPTPTSSARTATSATGSCACPRTSSGSPTTSAIPSGRRCWPSSSSTGWPCTTSKSSGWPPARATSPRSASCCGASAARCAARPSRTTSSSRRSRGRSSPSRWPATRRRTSSATSGPSRSSSAATSPRGRTSSARRRPRTRPAASGTTASCSAPPTSAAAGSSTSSSGNLSFQIEHHLFPDLPANRYAEISVEVREACERYGLPYNVGPLHRQFGSVVRKIFRLALPETGGEGLDRVPVSWSAGWAARAGGWAAWRSRRSAGRRDASRLLFRLAAARARMSEGSAEGSRLASRRRRGFNRNPALVGTVRRARERVLGDGDSSPAPPRTAACLRPRRPAADRPAGGGARSRRRAGADRPAGLATARGVAGQGRGKAEVTILFTDLVGFSSWALEAGDRAAVSLLRAAAGAVEPPVIERHGEVVKRLG